MKTDGRPFVIGVVGVCGSGKSTLAAGLRCRGIEIRHIAQEHSYVQTMWRQITNPDVLIYLDASYSETIRRRRLNWTVAEYEEQLRRLQHAREHADFLIDTNTISQEEVLRRVLDFICAHGLAVENCGPSACD
jgi:adenylate kinase family enzyme